MPDFSSHPSTRATLRALAWGVGVRPLLFARDIALAASQPRILRAYLALASLDRNVPPHHSSLGDDPALTWGSTPLASAVSILERAGVSSSSRVVDAGAGRGMVLLAARFLHADARGVELDPKRAAPAIDVLASVGAALHVGDARAFPLDDATHVFVAWTCMPDDVRAELARKLPADATLIALTWDPPAPFVVVDRFTAAFSWGRASVVVARRS